MSHSSPRLVLVYDVGGSHVASAVCEEQTFALHGISHAPLPADGAGRFSAASFCRLIQALGETSIKAAGVSHSAIAGASLAMPGPFDYEHGISRMQHKLPGLLGFDLKSALAARFGWQPAQLRFVNDAAAFLLGEMAAGAAKGYPRAIGITLGTGIGCSFATHDTSGTHVLTSGPGVPSGGEIWNLPYNGATVEDYVSTRYLRRKYLTRPNLNPGSDQYADLADAAEVSEIARIAADGNQPCPDIDSESEAFPETGVPLAASSNPADPESPHCRARRAFRSFGRHLGLALNQHAAAFAPDVIVLGGGISRAAPLFLPATRKALGGFSPKIVVSTLMDQAPLAGAGAHWFASSV